MADPSVLLGKSLALRMKAATELVERLPEDLTGSGRDRGRPIPYQFRRFELKTALSIGGTATAHPLEYDYNGTLQTVTDSEREFSVHDLLAMFRGRARDTGNSIVGSRGWAIKRHDKADWEILQIQPFVTMFRGVADGDITGTGTASVKGASTFVRLAPSGADWIVGMTPGTEELDVANPMGFDVDDEGVLVCAWDEDVDGYFLLQAACPA